MTASASQPCGVVARARASRAGWQLGPSAHQRRRMRRDAPHPTPRGCPRQRAPGNLSALPAALGTSACLRSSGAGLLRRWAHASRGFATIPRRVAPPPGGAGSQRSGSTKGASLTRRPGRRPSLNGRPPGAPRDARIGARWLHAPYAKRGSHRVYRNADGRQLTFAYHDTVSPNRSTPRPRDGAMAVDTATREPSVVTRRRSENPEHFIS